MSDSDEYDDEIDDDEYDDEIDPDDLEAEARKREVGMAPYGTDQYWRNAYYILSSYKKPNEETRRKLEQLRAQGYDK